MIIRCTKCSTEFALDPSQVGPEGVTLRCSVCSHMFHAEPDPDVAPHPWKVATVEKHLSAQPDLRRLLEQVEDGRLRPDDQVSRTGQTWLKLGELPEFSSLFIGAEGLPRVFRAVEAGPSAELGPPPAFGSVDDRREETVRFNLASLAGAGAGSGLRRPPPLPGHGVEDDPLPAPPEFDTALPAPPEFDTPSARRGRGVPENHSFARSGTPAPTSRAPASMLEAVTKAVAANEDRERERERGRDIPESEASRARSQPILVADLARAAAASAEKAVQAVDGQRARERAERSTGTFTGAMQRVDPSGIRDSRDGRGSDLRPVRETNAPTIPPGRGPRETADLKLAAAAARTTELKMAAAAAREAELTQLESPPEEANGAETAELTRPPEVVIVKMSEPSGRSSAPLWGLLGVAAAAGIVFGVPSIRERVFNLGGPSPMTRADPGKSEVDAPEDTTPEEVAQARKAIRNLGFKESNKVQAALQRVIDDPKRSPEAIAQARLTQAELVLMRALACKIAVQIEPAAMGGQAQTRSAEDPIVAEELLASIGEATVDANQLQRVRGLQGLIAGTPPATLPPESEELAALIRGAPLWRGELRTPPSGLITSLQRLANPSTLSQSVLALALWRSGDVEGARTLLRSILDRVNDQPAARTMLEALDRQDMLAENGDPEVAVPPSDPEPEVAPPEPEPEPEPVPVDPTTAGTPGDTKVAVVRPPVPGVPQEKVEVLISTGCQKVRQGDAAGVRMLLDAVDRGADPMQNFNLCFCLGAGFARQNSHDAALTWYKRAVQQSPSNRDAIAGAARSAELLGRTSAAVDYYKKLRALDPGNAAAAAYLAKHDGSHDPAPTGPDEPPGELMPIKPKNR